MKKIKDFLSKYKATILKFGMLLLIVVAISLITLGILFATGLLSYHDGFIFDAHMFDSFKGEWYGFIIFILVQTVLSMLLCAIPGVAMALVLLSKVIYSNPFAAFLLSFGSVMLSSAVLYIIGRTGGYRICEKLLGKEDCEKSLGLLRDRGTVYFPIMMLFPIFPDDALVMLAGVTKMKLSWFIPSIVVCRSVGIATIIFSTEIIPFESFNGIYDWIILITVAFFWVREIFKAAHKLDVYFDKRRKAKLGEIDSENKENSENYAVNNEK